MLKKNPDKKKLIINNIDIGWYYYHMSLDSFKDSMDIMSYSMWNNNKNQHLTT